MSTSGESNNHRNKAKIMGFGELLNALIWRPEHLSFDVKDKNGEWIATFANYQDAKRFAYDKLGMGAPTEKRPQMKAR